MFSEALRILDHNTAMYMVEQMQETINEQAAAIDRQKAEKREMAATLKEKDALIQSLQDALK